MSHAFAEVYRPMPLLPQLRRARRRRWLRLAGAVLLVGALLGLLCGGTAAIVLHWSAARQEAALQEVHLQGFVQGLSLCPGGTR